MRGGKSQLSTVNTQNKTKGGLNKDYAFQWSYGISETLTLFVPGMQGGGSAGKEITGDSKFADKLTEVGVARGKCIGNGEQQSLLGRPAVYRRTRLPGCGDLLFIYSGNGICKKLA